jgi:hypothetical protein
MTMFGFEFVAGLAARAFGNAINTSINMPVIS